MANDNNIKKFTSSDIEKYHKGLLSVKERHEMEKAALDDPFLADALEGYAFAGNTSQEDIADLKKRLSERITAAIPIALPRQSGFTRFLRVAAIVILFIGAGLLVYEMTYKRKKGEIAVVPVQKENQGGGDLSAKKPTGTDSIHPVEKGSVENFDLAVKPGNETVTQPVTEDKKTVSTNANAKDTVGFNAFRDDSKPAQGAVVIAPKATETRPDVVASGKQTDKVRQKDAVKEGKTERENKILAYEPVNEEKKEKAVAKTVTPARGLDDFYRKESMNTFRGRVTDPSNTGVPFANVTNTRDNVGTYTDANGYFTLTSTDTALDVQIRSLGFTNSNIQLRNNVASNRVVMQEDRTLSEVVINNQKPNTEQRSRRLANQVVVEPEPADGWDKYDSYLANNLVVPDDFKTRQTDVNYVQVSFEVDKNGEPFKIRIEKSLCTSCDKEAIRLIKEGPKWKRNAAKKGRTTVTINF
jgi:hypothetical protein